MIVSALWLLGVMRSESLPGVEVNEFNTSAIKRYYRLELLGVRVGFSRIFDDVERVSS